MFSTDFQEAELPKLFILLQEVHLVNYTHFDREAPDFPQVLLRYWLLLTAFGEQRRVCSPCASQIDHNNNTHLHKLMVHSPRLFMHHNLASYSCEQGESLISVIGRQLSSNPVLRDQEASLRRSFEFSTLRQEASATVGDQPRREPDQRCRSIGE